MRQSLQNIDQQDRGLFAKFHVTRVDQQDHPGGKHEHDQHFVLELTQDCHSIPAIIAYADSCESAYPLLAVDLRAKADDYYQANNEFVTVPETTLPGGMVVPSFLVGKYHCAKSPTGKAIVNKHCTPWNRISYHESVQAAEAAGYNLITETQSLAIAFQIYHQDENWTGGKVGEGKLFQGIRKGNVDGPQSGAYESLDPEEHTWHVLANGERIYHAAGNIYTWVWDNVQGDDKGIIGKPFADDSLTKTAAPCASNTNGIGDSSVGRDWSGDALVRGGYWCSYSDAGVFCVGSGSPSSRSDYVGFRVTKSL